MNSQYPNSKGSYFSMCHHTLGSMLLGVFSFSAIKMSDTTPNWLDMGYAPDAWFASQKPYNLKLELTTYDHRKGMTLRIEVKKEQIAGNSFF